LGGYSHAEWGGFGDVDFSVSFCSFGCFVALLLCSLTRRKLQDVLCEIPFLRFTHYSVVENV
jgi:hypothetical protein